MNFKCDYTYKNARFIATQNQLAMEYHKYDGVAIRHTNKNPKIYSIFMPHVHLVYFVCVRSFFFQSICVCFLRSHFSGFIPPLTSAKQSYRFCSMCIWNRFGIAFMIWDMHGIAFFSRTYTFRLFFHSFKLNRCIVAVPMQAIDPMSGVTTFHQIRIFKRCFNKQNDILTWLSGIVW